MNYSFNIVSLNNQKLRFTFMYLVDALIQSNLQCIRVIIFLAYIPLNVISDVAKY